ncbi:hypothetical protein AB4865_07790 [Capnocytophaga sp. ARDL2]|uniref:hypothetical protein n=1 Tax=Capnocytophaga sp. ARDL2 TaxID=3238809 RepID=UPI0035587AAE
MKTKTIYHLNENCDLVKIEKRTTLLGVAVKRETTIYKEHLKKDNHCSEASVIAQRFGSLRNSPDYINNWITKAPKCNNKVADNEPFNTDCHLQSETETLPQTALCDVRNSGKRFQAKQGHLLNVQSPSPEKRTEEKISICQQLEAERFLLEIALGQLFHSERHRSQQCGMSQVSELERFLLQVDTFQKSVKQHLHPLLENRDHNKI